MMITFKPVNWRTNLFLMRGKKNIQGGAYLHQHYPIQIGQKHA